MSQNDLFTDNSEQKGRIRKWAKEVVTDIKSAFGIHSPSTVMRDEVGKYLAQGMAQGLAENDKFVVRQFSSMLEKIKYQRDFDIISEDEYYTQLEALRDKYFSKGTENWIKYTEKIYSYQQKLLKQEKKAIEQEKKDISGMYDDIAKYASSRIDEVIKKQQKLYANLKNVGGLYNLNEVTINGVTGTYYSMHDLNRDIEEIRRYSDLMEEIKKRSEELGISGDITSGFLSELRGLDITSAIGLSNALIGASDEKFSAYINAWNTKNLLAENVSAKQYEQEFDESWEDAYENMKHELERAGYEIPQGFFTSGSISAEKFGEAFIEGLDMQMQKIREKIEEFNASLSINLDLPAGNTYNTTNTSYSINTQGNDTVEQIRRYETFKRLSGVK